MQFNKIKIKADKKIVTTMLVLFCFTSSLQAQEKKMTIQEAIDSALLHNQNIQAASLDVQAQQALHGTASEIGKTDVSLLYGQYNSINKNDNNFTITQTIPFPTAFSKKAALNDALVASKNYELQITTQQLVYQIKTNWNQLLYTYATEHLLLQQDSVYASFAKAADLRYKTGETNLLEKTTVETQRNEIKNKLQQNLADRQIAHQQIQALVQTEELIIPSDTSFTALSFDLLNDTATVNNHPMLAYLQQQVNIANAAKKAESASKLPDITVGYFNQSLIGYQTVDGQEKYFDGSKRFQGFQVGIAVPLWFKPYNARIKAADIQGQSAQARYTASVISLQSQYTEAVQNYLKYKGALNYYESSALTNADLIIHQARISFEKGETDYAAYLLALNKASSIKENYLQTLQQFNQNIFLIEYLISKK